MDEMCQICRYRARKDPNGGSQDGKRAKKVATSTTDGTIAKPVRNNSTAGCLFAPLVASQVAVQ